MDFDTIYNMILTVGMGAITFFLKRSFDKLDSRASHSDVEELKNKLASRASRSDVDELKDKLESADEKYASKSELNELKKIHRENREQHRFPQGEYRAELRFYPHHDAARNKD